MEMRNKHFANTMSKAITPPPWGGVDCCVRDFYDQIVVTVRGDTRDQARDKGVEETRKYIDKLKKQIAGVKIQEHL